MADSNGQKSLHLPLAGILSTSHGEKYLVLLRRYLEHLRDIYFNHQDTDSIKHTQVQEQLGLTSEDTAMLGRLVFSGFLSSSGGYQPDFSSWSAGLPAALDDLPSTGTLDASFTKILDELVASPQKPGPPRAVAEFTDFLPTAPSLADQNTELPQVFISYSHDGKEHKRWVLELSQKLHNAGIEVILDQWELGPGDDVVKFMERSVTKAERVLMICTEPYVGKVNAGKGGAGYEGTVVTGELIKDLGTAKFIPVIRQTGGNRLLPTCVNTRAWIDLSEGTDVSEELKKLISSLRREPPATKPPRRTAQADQTRTAAESLLSAADGSKTNDLTPIMPNKNSALEASPHTPAAIPEPTSFSSDPLSVYRQAFSIARSNDLAIWRKLVAAKKFEAENCLKDWRVVAQSAPLPRLKEAVADFARPAIATQQALMAVAIAGVESGMPKFNQQGGLVYDLMRPKGWERSGLTMFVEFPEANAFVFQALLGSMALYSNQNSLAIDMATQRVTSRENLTVSRPLFLDHRLVGWPRALDTDSTIAWRFLTTLPENFAWLGVAFGSAESFRECLCGYYLFLSWMEFLELLRQQPDFDWRKQLRLDVPPMFLREPFLERGARRLLDDRVALQKYSERAGVSSEKQIKEWANWVSQLARWAGQVFHDPWWDTHSYEISNFVADIHR
jgi:hypothetical protein